MIVVMGATGNVGRPLVTALAAAGAEVTAVSRNAAGDGVPAGVRQVRADLTDPETFRPALDGAAALFLHNGGAGAGLATARGLLDVAKRAGVRRVVLLSSIGVVTRPESESHGVAGRAAEDAVRESGLDWTILRPGGFASNAFAWAASVRGSRTVAAPFGDVGIPVVDPADIAAVAAAALHGNSGAPRRDGGDGGGAGRVGDHAGQVYELTGPELATPRQQAAAIGAATGEPVRFVELSRDQARAGMLAFMPADVADTTLDALGSPTAHELRISPDVERVTGRPAAPFAGWAERHAAAFR
jgi:uncharacterized protein YbjT (DUF2867 family)